MCGVDAGQLGCAVLLELLQEELPIDCAFAFTAQEEVGTRGAFGAAFSVTPEIALVLETTTAAQRFRGESETRFAQMACFLPVGQGKTEEQIFEFRSGLDTKFVEQSLEAPEGGSLYVDAYSGDVLGTVLPED